MAAVTALDMNNILQAHDQTEDARTPTTPRASASIRLSPRAPSPPQTRLATQMRPIDPALQCEPQAQAEGEYPAVAGSERGQPQAQKRAADEDAEAYSAMDVDVSDPEQDGSDVDTENGDPDTSGRKRKGQRFFCTGYPPCNLSFTRSEHLARHIRKHTGERPFQCHCNRRFSRLDNLRQHAQTVHVNEEIPTDSLAATGTRFQRQIRTDRVRPTGRPRTNTMSSTGSHGRGHSRNTSTSSIGSTSSNFSTSTETRRRPPPLAMATDSGGRPKLGIEPPRTPPAQYRGYGDHSPGGLSTPTSTTYSATPGSPGFGSSVGSPMSTASRLSGFFGSRTPARRLSVPSGASPFQPAYANSYPVSYVNQMGPPSNMSSSSSIYASPVSTSFAPNSGYNGPPAEDPRRRTWHPSTFYPGSYNYARPATSGLTYSQTPDAPQPAYAQNATAAAGQAPRLPGIESFDHVQHRPSTPPRRHPSPMQLDHALQPSPFAPHQSGPPLNQGLGSEGRPGRLSWDSARNSTYPPSDHPMTSQAESTSWSHQTLNELHHVGSRQEIHPQQSSMGPPPPSGTLQHPQQIAQEALQLQPTPKRSKRHGWYQGPASNTRTSPEDSSSSEGVPTPGTSSAEIHPAIMHSNGYIEPHHVVSSTDGPTNLCAPASGNINYHPRPERSNHSPPYAEQRDTRNDMAGLEALVAVATSEEKATAVAR